MIKTNSQDYTIHTLCCANFPFLGSTWLTCHRPLAKFPDDQLIRMPHLTCYSYECNEARYKRIGTTYQRWVEPEPEIRAWAYNKNQILSPRVGLGPKPDFFIYIVKPEPELSPTYLVTFSSPKKPEPES